MYSRPKMLVTPWFVPVVRGARRLDLGLYRTSEEAEAAGLRARRSGQEYGAERIWVSARPRPR